MSKDSVERTFDKIAQQQLEIFAKEFQQLRAEQRRLAETAAGDRGAPAPGERLGRYEIREKIGQGGAAWVFRAHDPELDRDIAIKVLRPFEDDESTFPSRFRHEAQATANLRHPSILRVYDFGEERGLAYIASEYVTGGTLSQRTGSPLDVSVVLGYATPLADALDYAHERGVVHRDIKPSNVLLDSDGSPILADFGIARVLESGPRLTRTKTVVGTPEYMSPEQVLGKPVDHRSDLYSLGVVLYELLLGTLPLYKETTTATMLAHVHDAVRPPSDVDPSIDPRLEAVLMKGLAKGRDDRYQSATALVQELTSTTGVSPSGKRSAAKGAGRRGEDRAAVRRRTVPRTSTLQMSAPSQEPRPYKR